jgi:CubicO group peptidase (beta-lactamase class C family)
MPMQLLSVLLMAWAICGADLQISSSAWSAEPNSCAVPLKTSDGWLISSPEEVGLNGALLCSLNEALGKSPEMNVHSVVVVRGGKLVYETYRSGQDEKWGTKLGIVTYTPQTQHDLRSVSKSVVSLLFGIAVDRKLVASLDDSIFNYFPDYAALRTPEKDNISLRHLLTMTSGIAWDEQRAYSDPENSELVMNRSVDPYRYVLQQPALLQPGKEWNYSGGATQLLAGVLQRTTGKWLADFAKEALFEPLGITQFEWLKMPANGEVAAASGLRLRPRDMAKIGELVLEKGMWNGGRVVSQAWIEESTRPRISGIDPGVASLGYGYQWWGDYETIGGQQISWIAAQGLGGQRIYIVPAYDLVVVVTAGLYGEEKQDWVSFNIFDKYVLAAIRK